LPAGRDSAETTWSKIRATACLKVAAAVLQKKYTRTHTDKKDKYIQHIKA